MKVRLVFAWYDLWIGAYWDRQTRTLYLMVPTIGIAISTQERRPEVRKVPRYVTQVIDDFTEEDIDEHG